MAEPDRTCRNDYPRYVALDMCVQSLYMCLECVGCCRYDWSYKFAQEHSCGNGEASPFDSVSVLSVLMKNTNV